MKWRPPLRLSVHLPWRLPLLGPGAVVAVSLGPDAALVRVAPGAGSRLPRVEAAVRAEAGSDPWRRWRQQGLFARAQRVVVVLPTRLRTTTLLPRPDVPDADLVSATRWQLAASLDYPAEDALLDVLPLPALANNQTPQVMALSARVDAVRDHIAPLLAAGVRPTVIDIEDTAQRNLALRAGPGLAAVATLGFTEREALLTVVADGELCISRAIALPDMATQPVASCERLTVQVQRTLDAFDRQATRFAVRQLQLLPGPLDAHIEGVLAPLLTQRLQPVRLQALFDGLEPAAVEAHLHHRIVPLLGAVLGLAPATADAPAAAGAAPAVPVAATAPTGSAPAVPSRLPAPAAPVAPAVIAQAAIADAARAAAAGIVDAPELRLVDHDTTGPAR